MKKIFLFTDGTGNAGGKTRGTNVWRLYNAIDVHRQDQIAFYNDGVGTADNIIPKALGSMFGYGLTRNIEELYDYLLRHYECGDRIYIFGFSRGAFTARCLAGLVRRCGILKKDVYFGISASEREAKLTKIVHAYRAATEEKFNVWRGAADQYHVVRIHFLGVWDTVDAIGMPIDELRPILDVLYRKLVGRRAYGFDDQVLSGVEHARHAISLDDERRTFHPNVWHLPGGKLPKTVNVQNQAPTAPTKPANIRQVWFAGAHSNVGGGYPKDHLAYVTLDWMIGELGALPSNSATDKESSTAELKTDTDGRKMPPRDEELSFDEKVILDKGNKIMRAEIQANSDETGRHYDPRTGPAIYYRYSPRRITRFYKGTNDFWKRLSGIQKASLPNEGIKIHVSAIARILDGTQGYAPLFLPDLEDLNGGNSEGDAKNKQPKSDELRSLFSIAFSEGEGPFSKDKSSANARKLINLLPDIALKIHRRVHSLVIARQFVYGILLVSTVIAFWKGYSTVAPVATNLAAKIVKGLVPELLHKVVDAAFANPEVAGGYLLLIAGAFVLGRLFKRKIEHNARSIYEAALNQHKEEAASPQAGNET